MDLIWLAVIAGALGLAFAVFLIRYLLSRDQGTDKIREISAAIQEGALAFLGREYRILAIFVIVIAIGLGVLFGVHEDLAHGLRVAFSLVFGALCFAAAGYIGMNIAIRNGEFAE